MREVEEPCSILIRGSTTGREWRGSGKRRNQKPKWTRIFNMCVFESMRLESKEDNFNLKAISTIELRLEKVAWYLTLHLSSLPRHKGMTIKSIVQRFQKVNFAPQGKNWQKSARRWRELTPDQSLHWVKRPCNSKSGTDTFLLSTVCQLSVLFETLLSSGLGKNGGGLLIVLGLSEITENSRYQIMSLPRRKSIRWDVSEYKKIHACSFLPVTLIGTIWINDYVKLWWAFWPRCLMYTICK